MKKVALCQCCRIFQENHESNVYIFIFVCNILFIDSMQQEEITLNSMIGFKPTLINVPCVSGDHILFYSRGQNLEIDLLKQLDFTIPR